MFWGIERRIGEVKKMVKAVALGVLMILGMSGVSGGGFGGGHLGVTIPDSCRVAGWAVVGMETLAVADSTVKVMDGSIGFRKLQKVMFGDSLIWNLIMRVGEKGTVGPQAHRVEVFPDSTEGGIQVVAHLSGIDGATYLPAVSGVSARGMFAATPASQGYAAVAGFSDYMRRGRGVYGYLGGHPMDGEGAAVYGFCADVDSGGSALMGEASGEGYGLRVISGKVGLPAGSVDGAALKDTTVVMGKVERHTFTDDRVFGVRALTRRAVESSIWADSVLWAAIVDPPDSMAKAGSAEEADHATSAAGLDSLIEIDQISQDVIDSLLVLAFGQIPQFPDSVGVSGFAYEAGSVEYMGLTYAALGQDVRDSIAAAQESVGVAGYATSAGFADNAGTAGHCSWADSILWATILAATDFPDSIGKAGSTAYSDTAQDAGHATLADTSGVSGIASVAKGVEDGAVGSKGIQEGAILPRHEGVQLDSLFGLVAFRMDDGTKAVDSLFYRVDHAVSGRGPFPWLKASVYVHRPEVSDSSYVGYQTMERWENYTLRIAQLQAMENAGWEIGCHSRSHSVHVFGGTDGEDSLLNVAGPNMMEFEIGDNYRYVADTLGFDVRGWACPGNAYPGGFYADWLRKYFEYGTANAPSTGYGLAEMKKNNLVWMPYLYTLATGKFLTMRTYGNPQDDWRIPTEVLSGDSLRYVKQLIKYAGEYKLGLVILAHQPYRHYDGATASWHKGSETEPNIYFDSLLVFCDRQIQKNNLRCVTVHDLVERMKGRITPGTNLIAAPGDEDGDLIPDGCDWTPYAGAGSAAASAWHAGNVYASTGGYNNGPFIECCKGSVNNTPIMKWVSWATLPQDADCIFSFIARMNPDSSAGDSTKFQVKVEWGAETDRIGTALVLTNVTRSFSVSGTRWRYYECPLLLKEAGSSLAPNNGNVSEVRIKIYRDSGTDTDNVQFSNWQFRLGGVQANYK